MKLTVITGPMFSGKTTYLVKHIRQKESDGKKVLVLKHKIDNRYQGKEELVTHDKFRHQAKPISHWMELRNLVCEQKDGKYIIRKDKPDLICIDEVMFFDMNMFRMIQELFLKDKIAFMVAGLDMDHTQEPMGIMPNLMGIATDVIKLKARCSVCGSYQAAFTRKKKEDAVIVEVGADDLYEPLCIECFPCK